MHRPHRSPFVRVPLAASSLAALIPTLALAAQERAMEPGLVERHQRAALESDPRRGDEPALPPNFDFRPAFDRLAFDEVDGTTWVRGADYKASFDARGAEFTPAFGPLAPRNEVVSLSPASVTVAGTALVFPRDVEEARDGERVVFDRGAFVERYDLALGSIEQSFVFSALPARGAIEVRIPISSSEPTDNGRPFGNTLAGRATDAGLEFRGPSGAVSYGRAVAIDADGHRADVSTTFEDGAVVLRVDEAFVAGAALPLVIDPVVSNVFLDSTTSDTLLPDVCWNEAGLYWFVVYEYVFSLTDSDVYSKSFSTTGTQLSAGWVDSSSNSWTKPRVAANWGNDQVFVVSEYVSSVPRGVWGRTVDLAGGVLVLGTPLNVAGNLGGDKSAPDVGADPFPSTTSFYCVSWQRALGLGASDVGYAVVTAAGGIQSGPTYFTHTGTATDAAPSVSKMNGGQNWLIAWQHSDTGSITFTDIYGGRVSWSGSMTNDTFPIATGIQFEFAPSVSSPLTGTSRHLVTYTRRSLASQSDIGAVLVEGTSPIASANLTTLETGPTPSVDQSFSSVDSDGERFLVTYSERVPAFGYDDVYAAELFVENDTLRVLQGHEFVYNISLSTLHNQVASRTGPSAQVRGHFTVYDILQNSSDRDVGASFFSGINVGEAQPFCFGDGSKVACPCGVSGGAKRGCANGSNTSGARLAQVSGTNQVSADSVALLVDGLPASAVCLFFQGTAQTPHTTFGDGLRCTAGTVIRLAVKTAATTSASYPVGGDLPISVTGLVPAGGGSRAYQVWYRDSSGFCTSATYNLSNGLMVHWRP